MAVLHTWDWGPPGGRPVLLVHGVTGVGARFRRIATELLPGRRAVAVDLRGHGWSTWDPPWGVERHVDDLLETMDALGMRRAAVVGHSFGGLLAMHLAAAAPVRVERMALLDPAVALPPAEAAAYADGARADESWATEDEARAARRAPRPPHAWEAVEEDLAAFLRREDDGRLRLRWSHPAVISAYGEMARPPASLSAWAGPVLLVRALGAPYVTEALVAALRRDAGARLTEVGVDSGHMLYWDAFEETAAALGPFLAAP